MMYKSDILEGNCPCCGRPLEPLVYYYHPQTGTLILNGVVINLTPIETVIFTTLVKAFPRTVEFEELMHKINGARSSGGTSEKSVQACLSKVRRKLERHKITISKRAFLLVKYP